jgi:hypothetical protein
MSGAAAGGILSPAGADPLQEAGDVVWYVRRPDGGQYGPAGREIMRGWLAEGRITPTSLVWREGWREWREAAAVFPETVAGHPEYIFESILAQEMSSHVTADAPLRPRRRPQLMQTWIIAILITAVVILSLVFLWILLSYEPGNEGEPPPTAAWLLPSGPGSPPAAVGHAARAIRVARSADLTTTANDLATARVLHSPLASQRAPL